MTVETEVYSVTRLGNGSTTVFSFSPMVIFDTDELEVITFLPATGVETVRTLGVGATNYSVAAASGSYPSATGVTGSITYPADAVTPIASGTSILIRRKLTLEQTTDIKNQGGYLPETQEATFDKGVMLSIQQQGELDRSLKMAKSNLDVNTTFTPEIVTPVAADGGKFLRLASDETKFELAAISTTTGSASDVTALPVSLSAGAAGGNSDYSREDHVHLLPTTVPTLAGENVYTESQAWFKGSDVASAGAMTLGAGNLFDITGTTTINSITSIGIGTIIILQFDGSLTLTNSAADLILPGDVDKITQAGDIATLYEYASGDWRLISYQTAAQIGGGASGEFLIGDTATRTIGGRDVSLQITGTAQVDSTIAVQRFSAGSGGPEIRFGHSAGAIGSYDVLSDNDIVGQIRSYGADGTDMATEICRIRFEVDDSSPTGSSIGGTTVFYTAQGLAADDIIEAMRIDNAQRLLIGDTATRTLASTDASLQVTGTSGPDSVISIQRFEAALQGPNIFGGKSRSATAGGYTVVQDNDQILTILGMGADGTDMATQVCSIRFEVDDASPAASSIGGAIAFSTAAGVSSDDLTERMRIGADGNIIIASGNDLQMNFTTVDDGFINFQATIDGDATSAISSLTTSGSTTHHIQIELNGTTAWIAVSTTDPS